jgi:membrane protease YdiL (CAAX protease family)
MSLPLPRSVLPRPALTTYFLLAFGISWIGVLAVVGPDGFPGTEEDFLRLIAPVVAAMLLGPSVAGIAAMARSRGRAGLRDLLERAKAWHVAPRWYAAALLTAPVVIVATLGVLSFTSPLYRPGIATTATPGMHLLLGLLTGAAAGFFEEIGWTGFAIPAMRRRLSPTQTGFLLGIAWGAWHTLVSWWGSIGAGDVPMAIYLPVVLFAFLIPYRILMVWVYERTQSLLLAMLMHGALTASVRILDPIGIEGRALTLYNAAMGGAIWLVVGVVALVATLRARRPTAPSPAPLRARSTD